MDHVPPQCFFPSPKPNNLITVPCCVRCNSDYSKEDDYIRFILTSLLDRSKSGTQLWEEKVVPGFIPRNPKVVEEIVPTLKDVLIHTDSGPVEAAKFSVNQDRVSRYFTRIAKGLLTHHYPHYDYQQDQFRVVLIPPQSSHLNQLSEVRDLLFYSEIGGDVFKYRHRITDTELSGLWMLVFYEAILILVYHTKQPT